MSPLRGPSTLAAALLLGLLAAPARSADEAQAAWEPVDEADGVRVFRKQVPGSAYLAFRGDATVDVSVARLIGVLTDISKSTQWVDSLVESIRLREPAEGESIVYNRYDLSWPVQDRDYVLHRRLEIDADRKVVTATFRSTEDPTRPERDCCVRAVTERTFWRFTQLGPDRARIEVEVLTDPRGSLPSWVVNLIQRRWPRNSILALTEQAAAPGVRPYPPLAGW